MDFSNLEDSEKVISLAAGGQHSLALTSAGRVFSWGKNLTGQLGISGVLSATQPTHVTALTEKVKMITCGESHSLAVTKNSELFAWGSNFNNQLGLGHITMPVQNLPQKVNLPAGNITSISGGNYHTLLVLGRHLFGFGNNINKQLTRNLQTLSDDVATPSIVIDVPGSESGEEEGEEEGEGEGEGEREEEGEREGKRWGGAQAHCGGAFSALVAEKKWLCGGETFMDKSESVPQFKKTPCF